MTKPKKVTFENDEGEVAFVATSAPTYGVFAWGGVEHNFDALSHDFRLKLMQHGIVSIQGNQVAAKIVAFKKKFPDTTDEDLEAETLRLREANYSRMLSGEYGLRAPGEASASVLEDIALELAKADAFDKLHTQRIAAGLPSVWPQGTRAKRGSGEAGISGEEATVSFGGIPMTRTDIARAMFNKNPDAYMERAKAERERRNADAKAKRDAKASTTVSDNAEVSLDDIL